MVLLYFSRRLVAYRKGFRSKVEGFWRNCGSAVIRRGERVPGTILNTDGGLRVENIDFRLFLSL